MADQPTPTPITKEHLVAAAGRDDAALKEFLRGNGAERADHVERVHHALDTLRRELPDTKNIEKARVARAARDMMEEHLATVQQELATTTDIHLKELEANIARVRDIAVQEERKATAPLSVDAITLELREVARDVRKGDWKTWATVAGVAVAAGVAVTWLYDHTIGWLWSKAVGDTEKPGFLRRMVRTMVGLGGAAIGVAGLSRLWAQQKNTILPVATATKEGIEAGWRAGAGETLTKVLNVLGTGGRTAAVQQAFERGAYATEQEYANALADALFADRVEIVWEGSVMHLVRAGTSVVLNVPVLAAALTSCAIHRDSASSQEALAIYVKGIAVYATSFGAIEAFIRMGQTGSLTAGMKTLATSSALWPVQVLKKANDARYYLLTHEGRTYIRSIAGAPGFYWNRLLHATHARSGTAHAAACLIDEWRAWDELRLTARTTADADFLAALHAKCAHIENDLAETAKVLSRTNPSDLPPQVRDMLQHGNARTIATWLREGAQETATLHGAQATRAATEVVTDAATARWTSATGAAKRALLAPDATPAVIAATEDAMQTCRTIGMGPDEALAILQKPDALRTLTNAPSALRQTLANAFKAHGLPGFERISTFYATCSRSVTPDVLARIAAIDIPPPSLARIGATPALRLALEKSDDVVTTVKQLSRLEHLRSSKGLVTVGGIALTAAALGAEILTYREMQARLTQTIVTLEGHLQRAGFVRTTGNTFRHPQTMMEIDIATMEQSIDALSTEQALRVGASAAGVGASIGILLTPGLALGPAGIALMAIDVTVRGALAVSEDERSRRFLLQTPTSVLAMIGMRSTVGKSERDVMDDASSWLWSDVLAPTSQTNENEKRLLRKKALSILFFHEVGNMQQERPDVAEAILGTADPATFLDEEHGQFWNVDFERIIKPYVAMRLFQRSTDTGVHWQQFRDLKIDAGVFDLENVGEQDLCLVLREAAELYAKHLQETRYRAGITHLQALEQAKHLSLIKSIGDIDTRSSDHLALEAARYNAAVLGAEATFGVPFSNLPVEGSTAVERSIQSMMDTLDHRATEGVDTQAALKRAGAFTTKNPVAPEQPIGPDTVVDNSMRGANDVMTVPVLEQLLAQGKTLWERTKGVGELGQGTWYANASALEDVRTFTRSVQGFPRVIQRPAMDVFLKNVHDLTEHYAWDGAWFGDETAAKRTADFQKTIASLKTALDDLESHTYHLTPVERAKIREETIAAPDMPRILFRGGVDGTRGDRTRLFIDSDGTTTEYRSVDGTEKRYSVPGGTLVCQSQPTLNRGQTRYDCTWSFVRSPDTVEAPDLYCFTTFEGQPQPGVRVHVPRLERREIRVSTKTPGTYLPITPASLLGARLDIAYRTPDGTETHIAQNAATLFGKGNDALHLSGIKTSSREIVQIIPTPGIQILRCTVLHPSERTVVTYHLGA